MKEGRKLYLVHNFQASPEDDNDYQVVECMVVIDKLIFTHPHTGDICTMQYIYGEEYTTNLALYVTKAPAYMFCSLVDTLIKN